MTSIEPESRGRMYFCFADSTGFSGQKAASELVMHGFSQRRWRCRKLPQPVLDREGRLVSRLRYLAELCAAWLRATRLLFGRGSGLWVGLGQTRASFLRDVVPVVFGRIGLGRARVVLSLNGNVFMQWPDDSLDARFFRFLLRQAGTVTVVGKRQQSRLIRWGIPQNCVHVVVNSCEIALASKRAVEAKLAQSVSLNGVRCLFLSSLIDTKGYPEFLEALHRLSALNGNGPQIEAVLCGRLVSSEFAERFSSIADAERWIEKEMAEINRSSRVRVRWVKGAAGADKAALFEQADVFILPTRYAVEAQPLVLLEAMASGCAIITTSAGEIPTILDDQTAVLLAAATTDALTLALKILVHDAPTRARLAIAAHARYAACYQVERHLDQWEKIVESSRSGLEIRV